VRCRRMSETLAGEVGDFRDVYVTGGGSRSSLGLRLRAALSGRRLHVMQCPEQCVWAGPFLPELHRERTGAWRKAIELLVREVATISPDPALAQAYAQQIKQYRYLGSALMASKRSNRPAGGIVIQPTIGLIVFGVHKRWSTETRWVHRSLTTHWFSALRAH